MQTLIIVTVIAVVVLLVSAVVHYASRPPREMSRWEETESATADHGGGYGRGE